MTPANETRRFKLDISSRGVGNPPRYLYIGYTFDRCGLIEDASKPQH